MNEPNKCGTCPFYKADPEDQSEGRCHFWPPMPLPVMGGFEYPPVKADEDFCFQHPLNQGS